MLQIGQTSLPRTPVTYLAMRLAVLETCERMAMAEQSGQLDDRPLGFLTEVPYLRRVAPQVQIDLLLDVWARHVQSQTATGTLLDEAVLYAACETAARLIEQDPDTAARLIEGGPIAHCPPLSKSLAERLRRLHLELDNDGDFLLISQFEDVSPDEASPLKTKFGLTEERVGGLFDAVSRWRMNADWPQRASGLLGQRERTRVAIQIGSYLAACRPRPTDPTNGVA